MALLVQPLSYHFYLLSARGATTVLFDINVLHRWDNWQLMKLCVQHVSQQLT